MLIFLLYPYTSVPLSYRFYHWTLHLQQAGVAPQLPLQRPEVMGLAGFGQGRPGWFWHTVKNLQLPLQHDRVFKRFSRWVVFQLCS